VLVYDSAKKRNGDWGVGEIESKARTSVGSGNNEIVLYQPNAQYAPIAIKKATGIHDRFLIIDDGVYHIGASVKSEFSDFRDYPSKI
jgi:hypothetical protein